MMSAHVVVARYQESLDWLFTLLREHENICTTVYNDGGALDIPIDVKDRIEIKEGDHVPCEPTKYTTYILENWDRPTDDIVIFLQGDPLYHNPTLPQVFHYMDQWNKHYQNLTLYPHPPHTHWGCAKEIEARTAAGVTCFADNACVWCDPNMDDRFYGEHFKDEAWVKQLFEANSITLTGMCETLGISKPEGAIPKAYAAMFATSWEAIKRHPKDVWLRAHNYVLHGTEQLSQKHRACVMEYMWAVLLHQQGI